MPLSYVPSQFCFLKALAVSEQDLVLLSRSPSRPRSIAQLFQAVFADLLPIPISGSVLGDQASWDRGTSKDPPPGQQGLGRGDFRSVQRAGLSH